MSVCSSSLLPSPPPSPEKIDGNSRHNYQQTDGTVGRVFVNSADDNQETGEDKERGRQRMAGNRKARIRRINTCAAAKDKYGGCRQTEKYKVNRDDVVEYLFVLAGKRNHYGKCALQCYRHDGHARLKEDLSNLLPQSNFQQNHLP